MLLCRVLGSVVSTCKDANLKGKKIMIVQELQNKGIGKTLMAIDCVDAGEGDIVIVVHEGGSSRQASGCPAGPVDAAIAGIVDNLIAFPKR